MKLDKLKYFVFGSAILLLTPSCNKYLDTNPDNRTEINSVDKVAQLVGTAYPAYDYLTFTEAASDNTEDKGPGIGTVTDITSRPYFWQDVAGSSTNTPTNYWTGCYRGIAAANQALEAIDQNNFGPAVLPYKGEALVARAYAHFMLVTLFAKAYVIGGANDAPGIPYVTVPETEVIKQYDRETVKSTYEKIEKDLTEGIALLSASAYSVPKFHFTPAAAHAFASRFYLFKGEWQKVIDHASAISTENFANIIRPINSTLNAMAYADYKVALTKDDQKYNLLLANQYSTYQRTYPRYGYGANLVKMFSAGYNITGKAYAFKIAYTTVPNYTTGKYSEFFYVTNQIANTGQPYIMSPLLTTDEALMNRAEAYARLNQFDNAIKDVNIMLSQTVKSYVASDAATLDKIKAFYSITDSQEAVIKIILETKKSIFLQEGIRWMDILRNRLTVKHNVLDAVGNETFIELGPDDNRRMFQLPEEARLSGVPLNPR
ncbi:RagB/SusD family nutrient uptake outer membrane protein [Pedobacter soli]|uniref:SusD family protein n=1 Tax=Pedobacter soli TaxID=390242 RepID=A0A1G6M8J7_9SPHI|nr:RagB/SusD family nutrient uptake outer membrane protein [Pedobacter soli]SDC51888.1 SusD family protein [Pedobacter soli]